MRQLKPTTPIINAVTAAVDRVSAAVVTDQIFYMSVQVVTSGTATGTLKLQFSNDLCLGQEGAVPITPTNWTDIPSASVTVSAAGAAGISKTELSYAYIRAVWTKDNGGTGTITVLINGMGA